MSHEAHHEEHQEGPEIDTTKSKPAFVASFWFVIILAGLFIAALNFVNVMSAPEEEHGAHGGATHTEAPAHGTEPAAHDGKMEGGHADATHEPTTTGDEKHEEGAESNSEHH